MRLSALHLHRHHTATLTPISSHTSTEEEEGAKGEEEEEEELHRRSPATTRSRCPRRRTAEGGEGEAEEQKVGQEQGRERSRGPGPQIDDEWRWSGRPTAAVEGAEAGEWKAEAQRRSCKGEGRGGSRQAKRDEEERGPQRWPAALRLHTKERDERVEREEGEGEGRMQATVDRRGCIAPAADR